MFEHRQCRDVREDKTDILPVSEETRPLERRDRQNDRVRRWTDRMTDWQSHQQLTSYSTILEMDQLCVAFIGKFLPYFKTCVLDSPF